MKILAPLRSVDEVESLCAAGADEFVLKRRLASDLLPAVARLRAAGVAGHERCGGRNPE